MHKLEPVELYNKRKFQHIKIPYVFKLPTKIYNAKHQ